MSQPDVEVDLLVIGFGKGGKTLAAAMGGRGARVAMIEQSEQMYGGSCINVACVPTKALVHQAEHRDGHVTPSQWYRNAVHATSDLTSLLRAKNFGMLDSLDTVRVVTGRASFVDSHTVEVRAGDDRLTVTAPTIVINTGAEPALPAIDGLRGSDHTVTSTELIARDSLPDHLVVLGGGYVGVEFASMHAGYGARVTLVTRGPRILEAEDPDISAAAEHILTNAGVRILTDSQPTRIDDSHSGVTVTFQRNGHEEGIHGDLVLAALGRIPATRGLNLEAAGAHTDHRGAIVVDDHLRSSAPHIFAIGDVNGGPQFTYISLDDYRIVLDQLTNDGTRTTASRRAVPYTVFMTPPLGRVGMTESQARTTGRSIKVATRRVEDMATVPRARIVGEIRGLMKAVVDAETDELLGAALLSYDAQEVINTVAIAMRHGITATQLRDEIYTHPSMTEALNDLMASVV